MFLCPYKSNFSYKLKLEIQPQVRITEHKSITPILQGGMIESYMVEGRMEGGGGMVAECTVITIHLAIVFLPRL